jgi:hypothetical protein
MVIVNQVHPELTLLEADTLHERATELASIAAAGDGDRGRAAGRLARAYAALATLTDMVDDERDRTASAVAEMKAANVVHVPMLDDDVHEFGALHEVGRHLLGERPPPWSTAISRQDPSGPAN